MAFKELDEPKAVSYVDLGQYAAIKGWLPEEDIHSEDQVRSLSTEQINTALFEMGVDLNKEIEERVVLHRPNYLSHTTEREDKPKVSGLCYFGYERKDTQWKEFKSKYKL